MFFILILFFIHLYLKFFFASISSKFHPEYLLQSDLKNLPNNNLVQMMDLLSLEFEDVKKNLISMTFHLDKVEELYNNSLKEFQNRA